MNTKLIMELGDRAKHEPVYPDPRFPSSLYYRFLKLLANAKRPKVSVELGVAGGGGSLYLAHGWPEGLVVGVDCKLEYPDNIQWMLDNIPNFQFWHMDSVVSSDVFTMDGRTVDILFIDTTHTYDQTTREFEAYQPRMADGAVVVLDDLLREGMDRVWAELPGTKIRLDHLHVCASPTDGGFGVVLL